MKLINLKNKKQNGYTLVELLIVLGLIIVFTLGTYVAYNMVKNSGSANTEARNLDTLRAGVKNLYAGSSVYTLLSGAVLNDGRMTPDSMRAIPYVVGDDKINNSFGGAVTVLPSTLGTGGGANNGFAITYNRVPGAVCSRLVTTGGVGFDQVTVAGVVVKKFGTSALNIPLTTTNCADTTGNGVVIIFESL